ncbi:MAG: signal peptidase I [Acidobacteria bacterium]|nr:signal peptidase I [Acidobacteriota bacterium]MCI0723378.1 signal peptidase I [Acidobacteriota bacterium]
MQESIRSSGLHPVVESEILESAAPGLLGEFKGWLKDILLAVVIAFLMVVFLYQPVKVEGTSMQPELLDQERIFVNKFVYHFEEIHRGDIVVFWYPKDPSKSFIKRVLGVPGDVVSIREGQVYINGQLVEERYVPRGYQDADSYPSVRVRDGHYYVLGDHRNASNDSRSWGLVPRKYIYGKAVFRYWPVEKAGFLD